MPLHPMLAARLQDWKRHTPYGKDVVAIKAGVPIAEGQRFGLNDLRHSLSNWLVNKAKVEPKTVQGILRHSKIQTMVDLYTQ